MIQRLNERNINIYVSASGLQLFRELIEKEMRNFAQRKKDIDDYFTDVTLKLDRKFYDSHEDWIITPGTLYWEWLERCHDKYLTPSHAAILIERAYSLFKPIY